MLINNKVEYIARDDKRQEISWVRIARGDGSVEVFEDSESPLSEAEKQKAEIRAMDCTDCHNRPAHKFPSPMEIVNHSLEVGSISRELPYIKVEAVRALDQDYKDTEEAMKGIEDSIYSFYREKYPEVFDEKAYILGRGVDEVQNIYKRMAFPEMKAKWSAYPDNIGHRDWPGCFRCHNNKLESEEGSTIFTTCDRCHIILAQGENVENVNVNFYEGLSFMHPGEDEAIEEYTECTDCHTGGIDVYD